MTSNLSLVRNETEWKKVAEDLGLTYLRKLGDKPTHFPAYVEFGIDTDEFMTTGKIEWKVVQTIFRENLLDMLNQMESNDKSK